VLSLNLTTGPRWHLCWCCVGADIVLQYIIVWLDRQGELCKYGSGLICQDFLRQCDIALVCCVCCCWGSGCMLLGRPYMHLFHLCQFLNTRARSMHLLINCAKQLLPAAAGQLASVDWILLPVLFWLLHFHSWAWCCMWCANSPCASSWKPTQVTACVLVVCVRLSTTDGMCYSGKPGALCCDLLSWVSLAPQIRARRLFDVR
jgi:hypothetical protein